MVHIGSSLERDQFCKEQEAVPPKGKISCRLNRTRPIIVVTGCPLSGRRDLQAAPSQQEGDRWMVDASKIGQSFPPYTIEVERGKVGELALAIGDENPIYQSRQAAQAAGYADVPLYPTSPTIFAFWGVGYPQLLEHWASLGIDAEQVLHGEEAFEYLCPIAPGDILTGVMTLAEAKTTKGQAGTSLDILTFEFRYTNQHGELALRLRKVILVPT